jgi:uncharacterized protein YecE (DUF72 family)
LVWADRRGVAVTPLWQTASWCYLRLHQGRIDWSYDDADLRQWAARLQGLEGYVYANNDPGGAAVRDAQTLRAMTTELSASGAAPATSVRFRANAADEPLAAWNDHGAHD